MRKSSRNHEDSMGLRGSAATSRRCCRAEGCPTCSQQARDLSGSQCRMFVAQQYARAGSAESCHVSTADTPHAPASVALPPFTLEVCLAGKTIGAAVYVMRKSAIHTRCHAVRLLHSSWPLHLMFCPDRQSCDFSSLSRPYHLWKLP